MGINLGLCVPIVDCHGLSISVNLCGEKLFHFILINILVIMVINYPDPTILRKMIISLADGGSSEVAVKFL